MPFHWMGIEPGMSQNSG